NSLETYFIDVEGGQATLFVTPARESLLIDTGWPDHDGRDAERITAAATSAGLNRIDYVLITHYHTDHVGGVPQLAARIPIGTFIDHGENREMANAATEQGWQAYQTLLASGKYKHMSVKPGDSVPLRGMEVTVVSSDGAVIEKPLPGAGQPNRQCAGEENYPKDDTENSRSVGTLLTYGTLRILDLGDLTRDKEQELVCPHNKLGKVDIYVVSHHGWYQSGSPALLNGIAPRVAIMDNGAQKGGSPAAWDVIEKSPRLEDLWQLHFSEEGGNVHNVSPAFISNPQGPDQGRYLELKAYPDGSFDIRNSRTHQEKHYRAKSSDEF
ncbi:MAG: MBL fold metallo-hydrolase, partial [Acidobacteria bacterium]|nr:MBL fold metallo-hydrolase [Acidobacteriota bacterium]